MSTFSFLPELLSLSDYGGNWDAYLNALYECFIKDWIESRPNFRGSKLRLKRHPIVDGKEATFWHLISEGDIEEDRIPDMRKCERIRWPRATLDEFEKCETPFAVWTNTRRSEERILIALGDFSYLVVLSHRTGYVLFWTAYPVEQEHQRKKLHREYADWSSQQKS